MGGRFYKKTPLLGLPLHWNDGGAVDGHLHNLLAELLDEIVGATGATWKLPVANFAALPLVLNVVGDARVVLSEMKIYLWNGGSWVLDSEGSLSYDGTWNANTNAPALVSGVGIKAHYYIVSVAGTTNLDGITDWGVGDWAIFSGTVWQKLDHSDSVTSVFGRQGAVMALSGDYNSNLITNSSAVPGASVTLALNSLLTGAPAAHAASHENGGLDEIDVTGLTGLLATQQNPTAHLIGGGAHSADTIANLNTKLSDATLDDASATRTPTAHAVSHTNGGSDELNVAGLSGLLADAQTPSPHDTSHENGGLDEIDVGGLSGLLADGQTPTAHATSHENGGSDEIDVAGLSGLLADAQNPTAHRASHISGGGDAFLSTDVIEAIVKRIQETAGPTTLDIGAIANGQLLVRSGTAVVGGTLSVFGNDYQTAISLGRSTTTSTAFQTKVTLVTGNLTGTYLVTWHAVVDQSSIADAVQSQLYNTTDAAVVGVIQEKESKDTRDRLAVGGFAEVIFAGASKSFEIQYRQQRGSTAGIQDARIMIWRVA